MIKYNKEESLNIIYACLCNGGLVYLHNSDVILTPKVKLYQQAKQQLIHFNSDNICKEDIFIQILRTGGSLDFLDINKNESISFDFIKALNVLENKNNMKYVTPFLLEEDDAINGFNLLQLFLYNEIIFN
jgi:hypothetical protein